MTMKTLLAAALSLAALACTVPAHAADLGDVSVYVSGGEENDGYVQAGYKKHRPLYYDNSSEPVYINPPPGTDDSTYSSGNDSISIYGNAPATEIYSNENPGESAVDGECLSNHDIKVRLKEQGWRRFHGLAINADVIGLTASRPNGLSYRLKIDRCSGVIIQTYLIDQPQRRQNRYQGY